MKTSLVRQPPLKDHHLPQHKLVALFPSDAVVVRLQQAMTVEIAVSRRCARREHAFNPLAIKRKKAVSKIRSQVRLAQTPADLGWQKGRETP